MKRVFLSLLFLFALTSWFGCQKDQVDANYDNGTLCLLTQIDFQETFDVDLWEALSNGDSVRVYIGLKRGNAYGWGSTWSYDSFTELDGRSVDNVQLSTDGSWIVLEADFEGYPIWQDPNCLGSTLRIVYDVNSPKIDFDDCQIFSKAQAYFRTYDSGEPDNCYENSFCTVPTEGWSPWNQWDIILEADNGDRIDIRIERPGDGL